MLFPKDPPPFNTNASLVFYVFQIDLFLAALLTTGYKSLYQSASVQNLNTLIP